MSSKRGGALPRVTCVSILALGALVAPPVRAQEAPAAGQRKDGTASTAAPGAAAVPDNEELARRIEVLARELEARKLGEVADGEPGDGSKGLLGLGPAASKVYRKASGLSVGGYGETLYQAFDGTREDGAASGRANTWDDLRAVLYVGWKFDRTFVLNTEIEYEHASTEGGGAVSVEFATLDALLRREVNLRAGLVLVPMGLINEIHEPPTYLGARRPDTERRIIPATWSGNGVGVFGEAGPVAYKLYVVEGLDASKFTAEDGIREGRQGGSEALADHLAVTGRLDLVSVPGLVAGAAFFSGRSGASVQGPSGAVGARTTVLDVHADYRLRGLWLRGVWARTRVSEVARLNEALGLTGTDSIGETQEGWYVTAGYELLGLFRPGTSLALTPFVRYERTDTQRAVPAGWERDGANDRKVWTIGLDFKPIPRISLKLDYQDETTAARTGVPQWNVALGYLF